MSNYRDEEESIGQVTTHKESTPPIPTDGADVPISKVHTSGTDNEFIHIGNSKVLRSDLVNAFGGDLFPSYHAQPSRKFANPAPLGLSAFALTTFVLSLINVQARGVTTANILVPCCFFYGGFVQLVAGVWEIVMENTFGATALCSYGGFWMSYGALLTPGFGVAEAYATTEDFEQAVGLYLVGWFIFTFLMCWATIRSTVAFFLMFFTVDITFILLAVGAFTGNVGCNKAGGWFGLAAAFLAWYNAMAGVFNKENSYVNIRPIYMPFAATVKEKS